MRADAFTEARHAVRSNRARRDPAPRVAPWRDTLHEIIFEADTPVGKAFDVALIAAICAAVAVVVLSTLPEAEAEPYRTTFLVLVGSSMIIVPTGILTAEMAGYGQQPITTRSCPACMNEGHVPDARFCKRCGEPPDSKRRRRTKTAVAGGAAPGGRPVEDSRST